MKVTMKAARVNAGMTQEEAAKALNITKQTLNNYENGKSVPKIDLANKMAVLYGGTLQDILFFTN